MSWSICSCPNLLLGLLEKQAGGMSGTSRDKLPDMDRTQPCASWGPAELSSRQGDEFSEGIRVPGESLGGQLQELLSEP